jgi:hypothetical protein
MEWWNETGKEITSLRGVKRINMGNNPVSLLLFNPVFQYSSVPMLQGGIHDS